VLPVDRSESSNHLARIVNRLAGGAQLTEEPDDQREKTQSLMRVERVCGFARLQPPNPTLGRKPFRLPTEGTKPGLGWIGRTVGPEGLDPGVVEQAALCQVVDAIHRGTEVHGHRVNLGKLSPANGVESAHSPPQTS